jgi:hypothetical protein
MYRIVTACVALTSLLFILPIPVHAVTIDKDWVFIDNRPTDDIFGYGGVRLNLTVRALDPGGYDAPAPKLLQAMGAFHFFSQ